MQLFGVVWIGGLCSLINGSMLGLEAGCHPTSDTMLCNEENRQDFHTNNLLRPTEARVHPGMLYCIIIKCE